VAEIAETDGCMGLNQQNFLLEEKKHMKKHFKCQESGSGYSLKSTTACFPKKGYLFELFPATRGGIFLTCSPLMH
jgi:hypothetical protein